ncbi:MAG TPA: hypothetical protein DHW42_11320 [Candidatus Marinimicrobia bacterium]|nr:hypothetical protein [Candidatus Neomarinimicrobiota bacterium]
MKNSKNIVCFIVFFMFYASLLWGQTGRHETFKTNALNYLKQRSNQIRGSGAQQIGFSHRRTNIDNFGFGHSRFQVLYKGIPIFANVIIVHFDKSDNAVRYGGGKIPDMDYNLSVEPDLTAEAAIEIVRNQMDIGAQTNLLDTTLMIWDGKLIDPSLNSINLVWKVEMISSDPPGEWIYFIDAHSGQIVNFFNNIKFALNRKQYDLECCTYWNTSCYPGTFLFGEGGSSSDPDAQGVYENLKIVYDYFDLNHGRDSYDGGGATIISSVHVGDYYGNCGFQNAFWWGTIQQFGYGDGDKYAQVRDVVGHEFTHAVTDYTANLYYGYQPGAMNESFSDLFASLIDDDDWLMGEELNGGAIRSMEDPTLYNQPDHMDDYLNTSSDNGGVHTNSGIPNKAFHYIAKALIEKYGESGADNGWERAGKIYYYALENLLSEYSNFNNLRTAILNAANICYPDNEYIQDAISRSFAAVGIGDCDITLTGTLAQSETWDGFVPVIGDITIPAGKTLTIDPGTSIFFKSNHDYESSGYYSSKTEIIVNGILNVIGSENSMIKFTSIIDDPNLDDWGGIIINSGGSYTFDYVKMYGAYYGIKPNYTSGTISNSHFEQNYIGTYLYHANSSNIHNCEFIDNQYGTAALYSSNLNFQNNSYDSNDYYGIYFNRSTGTFKNNVIENNSIHGFYINNQCDVDMNTWFEYDDEPTINNTIQNNASDGMWIGDGDIDIGTYLNIGTDFRGGFNYFNHGSGYLDIRYRGDDDMKAEANWWKNMAIDWDFGEIDTDPTASS